jgi:hypothetical protein
MSSTYLVEIPHNRLTSDTTGVYLPHMAGSWATIGRKGKAMTTEFVATRAEVQSVRVGMAALGAGLRNAKDLHRALQANGATIHYETIRRLWSGERKEELPFTLIEQISEATGFSSDWLVGKPEAALPDKVNRAKGVSRSSFGLVPLAA